MPFNECNAAAYIPIDTEGDPFSTAQNVALLIPALSAANSADILRRSLAILICSPIVSNISLVIGNRTMDFLPKSITSDNVYNYKQLCC